MSATRPIVRAQPAVGAQKSNKPRLRPKASSLTLTVLSIDRGTIVDDTQNPPRRPRVMTLYSDLIGVVSVSAIPYLGGIATVVAFFGKVARRMRFSRRDNRYWAYMFFLREGKLNIWSPQYEMADISSTAQRRLPIEDMGLYDSVEEVSKKWRDDRLAEFAADQPTPQFPYGPGVTRPVIQWIYDPTRPDQARPDLWSLAEGDEVTLDRQGNMAQGTTAALLDEQRSIGNRQYCEKSEEDPALWHDPIMGEPIPPELLVSIYGHCYNAAHLAGWIDQLPKGVAPTDPSTRQPLTTAQLRKIRRIAAMASK